MTETYKIAATACRIVGRELTITRCKADYWDLKAIPFCGRYLFTMQSFFMRAPKGSIDMNHPTKIAAMATIAGCLSLIGYAYGDPTGASAEMGYSALQTTMGTGMQSASGTTADGMLAKKMFVHHQGRDRHGEHRDQIWS